MSSPSLSKLIKLTSQVNGADKVFRSAVYLLKLYCWHLQKQGKKDLLSKLTKIASSFNDTRVHFRLFGLLSTIEYFPRKAPTSIDEWFELIQAASMLVYYPAEHVYWLSNHGLTSVKSESTINAISRMSCQAWALYIIIEIVKICKSFNALLHEELSQKGNICDLHEKKRELSIRLVSQVCDLVLALHWSLKSSPISPFWIGCCGSISSLIGLVNTMKRVK